MSVLYRALLFIGHSSWSWLEYISAGTSASSTGGLSTNSSDRGTQGSAVSHDTRSGPDTLAMVIGSIFVGCADKQS